MIPALKFTDLQKFYGKQKVLHGVSLEIPQGSFVGLIGENGAGKTTLIKCLLDFCDIQNGKIEIFGVDHHKTVARKPLAFLPERFSPPYFVTGQDFLDHMARMYRVPLMREGLDEVLTALDLPREALEKPVRTLSKGMSQKLGLAAVLLSRKRLLLLDEPMSGLDPKARALLKQHLLDLKNHGKTLFFSTHLLSDVEALCDEIIILHEGKVCFSGTPHHCCDRFATSTLEQAYISCIS